MRLDQHEGHIRIVLSKRNLEALLHKVDQDWSEATIYRNDEAVPYSIVAERDEVHYADREAPGEMHPLTEAEIAQAAPLSQAVCLWHDDVRPAPEGWTWAKTNAEAQAILAERNVWECSLDHDLGAIPTGEEDPTEVLYLQGDAEETGLDLVKWMIENTCVPPIVRIHSWNPAGAERMAQRLSDAGFPCVLAPYVIGAP